MLPQYTAYIDEAGDEGFGKLAAGPVGGQSRWLILGACLVSRENDLKLPTWRNQVISRFPKKKSRDLHFRDLKHEQKIVVCQEISGLPIGAAVAMSHKVTIPGSRYEETFKKEGYLYNYLLRWLLERVTHACATKSPGGCSLKIVFSRRANSDYNSMREYLALMRDGKEVMPSARSINWKVLDIDQIAVENHSKWAGLQIADCITSAFFNAVEPNVYGNYEPTYANLLRPNLIKRRGIALDCGVTPVPSLAKAALDAMQSGFFQSFAK
ncbi:DUF3800 domain-containing protein [Bosea sp. ASV33]|uniref:DUF3800 domain-containing protein n=1 Tax=Bosea sp. ASV33 TaxID=2795106 RepID=UPI0018ECBE5C|nr:DUF3800 domain-containing protein [Bosea sp. ASV33]